MGREVFQSLAKVAILIAAVAAVSSCAPSETNANLEHHSERAVDAPHMPVSIREPLCPTIATGMKDEKGRDVTVACATCHTTRPANAEARLGTPLKQFHQGQVGQHGSLTCISCHNATEGYGSLRFADGQSLAYEKVIQLCAQCHGPQFRDYEHGAHGGMNGYWDLTKGGRVRNNCIDCHDPHAPRYPTVMPARGPNDRFLDRSKHE